MESFARAVRLLSQICGFVAAALIACGVVVVCEMVFVRFVLNENTIWQTDFVTYSLVAATFIGSPYVLLTRGHVNVDDNDIAAKSVVVISRLPNGEDIPGAPGDTHAIEFPGISEDGSHILMQTKAAKSSVRRSNRRS